MVNSKGAGVGVVVGVVEVLLALAATTALWPGRRGWRKALSFPLGLIAGEVPLLALVFDVALVGFLRWWGWPATPFLQWLVAILAAAVALENAYLVGIHLSAERVVRRALEGTPLDVERTPADRRTTPGWRRLVPVALHPPWLQITSDIAYGPDPRQRLDVWRRSRTPQRAPVLVYLHGGAWMVGDKREQGRPLLHEMVGRDWLVVTANYRLAPDHRWPAQMEDVNAVMEWVSRFVAVVGGDPERVVVAGDSAGGQMAMLYALSGGRPWAARTPLVVRGVISLYGVLEMTGDESVWRGWGAGIRRFLDGMVFSPEVVADQSALAAASPLDRLHLGSPPMLVVQGTHDTLVHVEVARHFVTRARALGLTEVYYVEMPVTQHAFDIVRSPRTSSVVRASAAFCERTLTLGRESDAHHDLGGLDEGVGEHDPGVGQVPPTPFESFQKLSGSLDDEFEDRTAL